MSRIGTGLAIALAVAGFAAAAGKGDADGKELAIGDKAPAFSLPGTDGGTHALKDDLGKRPVVIAWFPKAFTSG